MTEERRRPLKQFVVLRAHGPYRKGDKIQPTGMYRDVLLKRGLIEEIKDEPVDAPARMKQPAIDRMIALPDPPARLPLVTRGRRAH